LLFNKAIDMPENFNEFVGFFVASKDAGVLKKSHLHPHELPKDEKKFISLPKTLLATSDFAQKKKSSTGFAISSRFSFSTCTNFPDGLSGYSRWRDGRVAEGARLESVFTLTGNVGSNPTLSAIFHLFPQKNINPFA
jgi:hypothetical protein